MSYFYLQTVLTVINNTKRNRDICRFSEFQTEHKQNSRKALTSEPKIKDETYELYFQTQLTILIFLFFSFSLAALSFAAAFFFLSSPSSVGAAAGKEVKE